MERHVQEKVSYELLVRSKAGRSADSSVGNERRETEWDASANGTFSPLRYSNLSNSKSIFKKEPDRKTGRAKKRASNTQRAKSTSEFTSLLSSCTAKARGFAPKIAVEKLGISSSRHSGEQMQYESRTEVV